MDEDHLMNVIEITKLIDLNKQIVEQENEVESDGVILNAQQNVATQKMRNEGGDFESWVGGFQKLLECDKEEWYFESCWSGIMLYWRAGKFDHAFEVFRQMGEVG
ncbi:hypothetical protein Tco_0491201 [Tanacetum coccineum]